MSETLEQIERPADEVYDPSNPEHVAKRRREKRIEQKQADTAMSGIMSVTEGRRWVYEMLDRAQVFRSTFTTNALTTAFNEGRRSFGLEILADVMRAAPDAYVQMMKENTG